ncbi:MAG: methyltransferase domain-containing protein [Candidatus Sericytochromatia bacterium]
MSESKSINFRNYNIELSNGQKTLAYSDILFSDRPVVKAIKRSINNFLNINKEDYKNIKIADIGCMDGGYSVELAKEGFNVLGIDARKENLLRAMYLKLNLKLDKLNFVKDDARNLSKYGTFDIVFCFGLLYHLDNPVDFLKIIYNQTNRLLILNTYYAYNEFEGTLYKNEYEQNLSNPEYFNEQRNKFHQEEVKKEKHLAYIQHIKNFKLSPEISENEGYKGRWFNEWSENTSKEKIEIMPGASYNNHKSFWLCKDELLRALYDVGFQSVYEQYDDIGDLYKDNPNMYYPRTLLIAVK